MEKISFDQLQEQLYHEKLDNGLSVFLLPKPGFQKTYATLTANYGSIDNHFVAGDGSEKKVPDGIAHFLEHKMFESEEGDVFQEFSAQGASANAFTSFTRTAYLFSATSNVEKNLTTLLDFVQEPYFTENSVEKEKGIIEQEIKMYEDNPDWQNFFGLLKGLYKHHPVQIDIAGTVDSIRQISKEDLYTCYESFYHPSNMVLFVVGNLEPEKMMTLIRANQSAKTFPESNPPQRILPEEPVDVQKTEAVIPLPVQTPRCLIGIKQPAAGLEGRDLLQHELGMQLLLELAFGSSSSAYQRMYAEGLINDSFSFDYTSEKEFGFIAAGGETARPDDLVEALRRELISLKQSGVEADHFERLKKKKIGFFLRALNSPEYIANQFTRYHFNGMNLFDAVPVLEALDAAYVERLLEQTLDFENRMTVSKVIPAGEASAG
ncbi:EF-P 5-aminopentanol modification-associated protein YfmH [Alkalicoccus luteus]|uniref:Insulinase family protein n=1 Tax=Alkalicoccus luteus TaxID=1237094 RepID=A0A969TTI2_9BACI|nr:pitrilysin family protein [Alkalicoccus luteus]NJP36295.1 insulinase family protein [Alkalicoccus luteus]